MAIGFDTPSKAKNEAIDAQKQKSPLGTSQAEIDVIKAQTVQRLNSIGNLIIGENFARLSVEQKAKILSDFAYYSKIIDTL